MLLIDLVVPIVGFYILRAIGVDSVPALIFACVPTAVAICVRAVRQRKVDVLGIFVMAVLAGSLVLTFVTGSPRALLAREGWFTGAIGAGFIATLWFSRPLAFSIARAILKPLPLASTLRVSIWDELWNSNDRFRRIWRVATVMWGVGLIADAIIRVIMAYTLPVDVVPALSGGLWAVTFVALQIIQQAYFARVGLWASLSVSRLPSSSNDREKNDRL